MENKYNLIDENWIPVSGRGKISLKDLFCDDTIIGLSGTPVEKISLFKLLLAIAQSACTPNDEDEWKALGKDGMKKKILPYLENHRDCFYLYGEKPFLQMKAIKDAELKSFGTVQMEIATGNTTVVTEIQKEKVLTDDAKAVLLITLMGFACGGKKVDNSVVLTKGYTLKSNDKGKPASGKPGPSLGFMGFNHSFFTGASLLESIYINLMSKKLISDMKMYPMGIGSAPWENMPLGEDDEIARNLKSSYMGRLVPLNRFVLFEDNGLHYSEGIFHLGYESLVVDPSVSVDFGAKPKPKVIWITPDKKPWRQLTSLLSFLNVSEQTGFTCLQLSSVYSRLKLYKSFKIWSGGVKVSYNAGEQYLTGTDDYVESEVEFSSEFFTDATGFFDNLSYVMEYLETCSKRLYSGVNNYYKDLMVDKSGIPENATFDYWQLCESQFQNVVNSCGEDSSGDEVRALYPIFNKFVYQLYNNYCPRDTARQLESWAKNKPRL